MPLETPLPTASAWYATERLAHRVTRLTEPHVHPLMRANMFLVEGRDADLLVDAGMGVAPLRPVVEALRADPAKPLRCLVTHAHADHMGAAPEFDEVLAHPLETAELERPGMLTTLMGRDLPSALAEVFVRSGYPPIGETMLEALPHPGFDPETWRLPGTVATGEVVEGDAIDLGDRRLEVLHLPGHAAGQVGLFERDTGLLFAADAVYDGPLVWEVPGMDLAAYRTSLARLADLPVTTVHGGHDPSFGPDRLAEIVATYRHLWGGR